MATKKASPGVLGGLASAFGSLFGGSTPKVPAARAASNIVPGGSSLWTLGEGLYNAYKGATTPKPTTQTIGRGYGVPSSSAQQPQRRPYYAPQLPTTYSAPAARRSSGSGASGFSLSGPSSGRGYSVTSQVGPSQGVREGLDALVSNYNVAYGKAKATNEARYNQMLGIADRTTNQRAADIQSSYGEQQSDSLQRLARLGMANTTVAPTMSMGIEREKQAALSRNADLMQQTKLGIIERRKDAYPDLASLQSTLAGVGAQYGGGLGISPMLEALGKVRQ